MGNKEQVIEYPHCKECSEYYICKKRGLNKYKPKFLGRPIPDCRKECAYDHKCDFREAYECPEYREWCYNDMEVAKELGLGGCYTPPQLNLGFGCFNFKNFIQEVINEGKRLLANNIANDGKHG